MKVLHLNTYAATGGAARAAFRLHEGLRGIGLDSRMLVKFDGGRPDVETTGGGLVDRVGRKLERVPLLSYPTRVRTLFTPAVASAGTLARVRSLAPEVVHLHWIADGLLRIEDFAGLGRPRVWTLHDAWAFTGGCHVPQACSRYVERCGACPLLGSSREDDLSRRVWERKRRAWRDLPIALVAPSRWLADRATASGLFAGRGCEVIPNGLDLERFRPGERDAARARLGIATERLVVLSGGVHVLDDPNKGSDLLVEALRRLPATVAGAPLEWVMFGAAVGARLPEVPMSARSVGFVNDEARLRDLYVAADVFVVPSRQENLPNTIVEAMACGTPVAAFDAGGIPDLVIPDRTGRLAPPFDPAALAHGIAWVLEDPARRRALGAAARRHVEAHCEVGGVARRYAALYERVAAESGSRP